MVALAEQEEVSATGLGLLVRRRYRFAGVLGASGRLVGVAAAHEATAGPDPVGGGTSRAVSGAVAKAGGNAGAGAGSGAVRGRGAEVPVVGVSARGVPG